MSLRTEKRATAIRSSSARRRTRSLWASWTRAQTLTSPAEKVEPASARFVQAAASGRSPIQQGGGYETAHHGGGNCVAGGAWSIGGQQDHDGQDQRQHVRGVSQGDGCPARRQRDGCR